MPYSHQKLFLGLALLGCIALVYVFSLEPSHERVWQDHSARTPDMLMNDDGTITIVNVRDWNHDANQVLSTDWQDVTLDPKAVEQVWFGYSGFSKLPLLAHTFVSFEFSNGEVYTLSIEARREADESFSAFLGIFNQYDLWYGWGTERDFVGVRTFLLKQPVEMYPLDIDKKQAEAVFVALTKQTAELHDNPRFYNTLHSNCTNELADTINAAYPGSIPYSLAQNLPGLSLSYLKKQELLTYSERSIIDGSDPGLRATINQTPADFSRVLREER